MEYLDYLVIWACGAVVACVFMWFFSNDKQKADERFPAGMVFFAVIWPFCMAIAVVAIVFNVLRRLVSLFRA